MGQRIIRVSGQLLRDLLQLPTTCQIVDAMKSDFFAANNDISLKVESADFGDVRSGCVIPFVEPVYEQHTAAKKFAGWAGLTPPSYEWLPGTYPPVSESTQAVSYYPTKRYVRQCYNGVEQSDTPEGPWTPVIPNMLPVGQVAQVQKTDDDVLLWPVQPPVSTFDARIVDTLDADLRKLNELDEAKLRSVYGQFAPVEPNEKRGREFI